MSDSTAVSVQQPGAVDRFEDPGMLQTLKDTVCKGATDSQFRLFIEVCRATQLNPFIREIWFVPGVGVMAGRDGYLAAANRHPMFDGMETLVERDAQNIPIKATCKVWRKDRSHPITCEAYYNEYKKASSVWTTYKSAMIGKVAEVLALKRSFSINGIVTEEEIGEQPNPNGSREAQQAVAADLIEQGTKQLEATKEQVSGPRELSKDFATLKKFKTARGQLGDFDYYRILRDMYGVEHANEITDPDIAARCLKTMRGWLNKSEPWVRLENRDKARFDALLESEGCMTIAEAVAHADSAAILLRIELEMSAPAKPKTAIQQLAELAQSDEKLFWHVAGNNGCGTWADVEGLSPAAKDKLLALVKTEIELGVQ